jgi:glycosyltransferase involved in cell wall biosynthesis
MPHSNVSRARVAIFFSHGVGLNDWDRAGLASRELGYLRELAGKDGATLLVTYDSGLTRTPEGFTVLANARGLHRWLYSVCAPLIHYRHLRTADVFRTNQLSGSWTAAIASLVLGKPLVIRCGFVRPSRHYRGCKGAAARLLVRLSLLLSNLALVASEEDRIRLIKEYGVQPAKVVITRNSIDTRRFSPRGVERRPGTVAYVGRLSPEKNVEAFIKACLATSAREILIAGVGPDSTRLKATYASERVRFLGSLPNTELPELLSTTTVFVLASQYEGSPKALLEAMACGTPVVGTDVRGIRSVILNGHNGLLADLNVEDIRDKVEHLLGDSILRARLAANARAYVVERHELTTVAATERTHLAGLIRAQDGRVLGPER